MGAAEINTIKVFSATKARDRERLGERVTEWLRANPSVDVSEAIVRLSSDRAFHCLSIILLGHERLRAGTAGEKTPPPTPDEALPATD